MALDDMSANELADLKKEIRRLYAKLMREHGFKVKSTRSVRWLPDMQQTCALYSVGFLPWFTIEYSVRLFRKPTDASVDYKEQDVNFDIRSKCGLTEDTLWGCGLNLEVAKEWVERSSCIESIINDYLLPHLEQLGEVDAVYDIIRRESVRRKHEAIVSLAGYSLIGGYENAIQDVN